MVLTCIEKYKDNGVISRYKLQDGLGNEIIVTSNQLKQAIINKKVQVSNLTLTSNNKLIDITKNKNHNRYTYEQRIKGILAKARILNNYKEIPTADNGHCCYLVHTSNENIVYIPDDVVKLNNNFVNTKFTDALHFIKGNITVYGGNNLEDASSMFSLCRANILDLRLLNTSKVKDMSRMFEDCEASFIDLSYFDTREVTLMYNMFHGCKVKKLDLSSFNTCRLVNMSNMFFDCKAKYIDLSSFDTSNVGGMQMVFHKCKAKIKITDKLLQYHLDMERGLA